MHVIGVQTRALAAPQDSLTDAILGSKLSLKNGDIFCVSSKIVSIDEGRCVPIEGNDKEELIKAEADWYMKAPRSSKWRSRYTINQGVMVGSAGIDESNGSGHYILYPKDPFKSAKRIRSWLMKTYGLTELGVIVTDSMSMPLRRGAIGFALSWDGIDPLRDYRGTPDIFGRKIKIELANLVDALAAAAVFEMGEGAERTPIAVIRGARNVALKNRSSRKEAQLIVEPENDVFAPLFWSKKWKRNPNR